MRYDNDEADFWWWLDWEKKNYIVGWVLVIVGFIAMNLIMHNASVGLVAGFLSGLLCFAFTPRPVYPQQGEIPVLSWCFAAVLFGTAWVTGVQNMNLADVWGLFTFFVVSTIIVVAFRGWGLFTWKGVASLLFLGTVLFLVPIWEEVAASLAALPPHLPVYLWAFVAPFLCICLLRVWLWNFRLFWTGSFLAIGSFLLVLRLWQSVIWQVAAQLARVFPFVSAGAWGIILLVIILVILICLVYKGIMLYAELLERRVIADEVYMAEEQVQVQQEEITYEGQVQVRQVSEVYEEENQASGPFTQPSMEAQAGSNSGKKGSVLAVGNVKSFGRVGKVVINGREIEGRVLDEDPATGLVGFAQVNENRVTRSFRGPEEIVGYDVSFVWVGAQSPFYPEQDAEQRKWILRTIKGAEPEILEQIEKMLVNVRHATRKLRGYTGELHHGRQGLSRPGSFTGNIGPNLQPDARPISDQHSHAGGQANSGWNNPWRPIEEALPLWVMRLDCEADLFVVFLEYSRTYQGYIKIFVVDANAIQMEYREDRVRFIRAGEQDSWDMLQNVWLNGFDKQQSLIEDLEPYTDQWTSDVLQRIWSSQ